MAREYGPAGVCVGANVSGVDRDSIPLSQVLDSAQIYVTRGATKTGIQEAPSRQLLEQAFETEDMDAIIQHILESGQISPL